MTTEEVKEWQAEHLAPEKKEEAEELAKKYESKDIINYSTLYNLLDLVGLLDECPCPVVQESDVDIVLDYGVQAVWQIISRGIESVVLPGLPLRTSEGSGETRKAAQKKNGQSLPQMAKKSKMNFL